MRKKLRKIFLKLPVIGNWLKKKNYVAVVRLNGVIAPDADSVFSRGSLDLENTDPLLESAFSTPDIKAVALVINSPGGTPVQAALIAERIQELSKENKVKTFAFIEDVAASGGYWLACAADEIYAHQGSIVGSIGVISSGFGFDKFIKKHNIERRIYTAGTNKSMLDPFEPEDPKDIKNLKDIQNELHKQFIEWVKSRRGKKLNGSDKKLFNGDIWTGETAKTLGLIDDCQDMKRLMKRKYGKKVRFIEFEESKGFLASIFTSAKHGTSFDYNSLIQSFDRFLIWSRFLNK